MNAPINREKFGHILPVDGALLASYRILDTPRDPGFDELALLASKICGTEMAAVTFIDGHRQWFKASVNLPVRETPIGESFCAWVVKRNQPLIVEDATASAAFATNLLVTGQPGIRFYAGVPIRSANGVPLGALCVISASVRVGGLTELQRDALTTLAAQVERLLEMRILISERDECVAVQRKLSRELVYSLQHDVLTELPNRLAFECALSKAVERANSSKERAALILLDLDHFKQINDWLGHGAGDEMLRDFSRKVRRSLRASDFFARLGGDEFGIILHSIGDDGEIQAAIESIAQRLQDPMQYQGHSISHRQSIGVALYPDDARSADDLMKHGDLALVEGKSFRRHVTWFRPSMADAHKSHMERLEQAKLALRNGSVVPYYQPKVDLTSGQIVGFEALARHERLGLPPEHPELFDALFQDSAVSRAVTACMTEQVLRDISQWDAQGVAYGHVALNVSAHDFSDDSFGERLLQRMRENGVKPASLQVEVTETVLLGRGQAHVERALHLLHEAGIRIALDDFGTGHASLVHLKRFPVQCLKIDMSFIRGIDHDLDDAAIVGATIGLARSLGMETVAEGIETQEQLRRVKAKGCDIGQGYLFSKAIPAAHVHRVTAFTLPLAA